MRYETPELLLAGPADSIILGVQGGSVDRMPESDLRKGSDIEEGLDD